MVRGFAMESQDKRMCKTEPGFPGVMVVDYKHHVHDDDCFGDILNMFDFPMESLEGDGFAEDWASKLGPIPSEVFRELLPPASQIGIGNGNNNRSTTDLPFQNNVLNNGASQLKHHPSLDEKPSKDYQTVTISLPNQQPTFIQVKRDPSQAAFEALSPNSVLESRSSSSNSKGISLGIQVSIPVKNRSKRFRPTTNPWLSMPSPQVLPPNKLQKRKTPAHSQLSVSMETKRPVERSSITGVKKCGHCEITRTPQWREGPMGPKTLCNACGVRYRSGRLYPEYRPAASPTFVPTLHSNSHRKVIEMRQRTVNFWISELRDPDKGGFF